MGLGFRRVGFRYKVSLQDSCFRGVCFRSVGFRYKGFLTGLLVSGLVFRCCSLGFRVVLESGVLGLGRFRVLDAGSPVSEFQDVGLCSGVFWVIGM